MISKSFSNSTYLTFPILAFSAFLFHGRFMHDIGYIFWLALHFFAGFAVCHSFNHLKNLHTAFILCVFFAPPNLNRGKGKGGSFPRGVAITVPCLILSHSRKKNQLPKRNFISVVITPPATAWWQKFLLAGQYHCHQSFGGTFLYSAVEMPRSAPNSVHTAMTVLLTSSA